MLYSFPSRDVAHKVILEFKDGEQGLNEFVTNWSDLLSSFTSGESSQLGSHGWS
jgi:hypothetical protein